MTFDAVEKHCPVFFGHCPLIFVEITYVKQRVDILYFEKDTKEYSLFRKINEAGLLNYDMNNNSVFCSIGLT